MQPIPFKSLPLIVRVATIANLFLAWVLFAEIVIDRHGIDRFLPLYRVGNLCPYDLAAAAVLILTWRRLHRQPDQAARRSRSSAAIE